MYLSSKLHETNMMLRIFPFNMMIRILFSIISYYYVDHA